LLDAKKPYVILPLVYLAGMIVMAEEVIRLRDYLKANLPYRAPGFDKVSTQPSRLSRHVAISVAGLLAIVTIGAVNAPEVLAALRSNTVSLVNNRLSEAPPTNHQCTSGGSNNTTINISNNSSQSSSSGSTSSSGNTTGGSSTSGNSTNNNSTNINININNCP
jgi:uncharacterized membrane protein YgcG